jgi:diguanylate cyclase (GGDEF)-like protein/PAS domain S-box-containing protein
MPDPNPLAADLDATRWPAHRRVRTAMLGLLVAAAAVAGFQYRLAERDERLRMSDGDVVVLAAAQRAVGYRLSHLAEIAVIEASAYDLERTLRETQAEALALDDALRAQRGAGVLVDAGYAAALSSWQDTREILWYRTDNLVARIGRDDSQALDTLVAKVGEAAGPFVEATNLLVRAAHATARERSVEASRALHDRMLIMMIVLGALALVVVEPTARALERQNRQLRAKRQEMEALLAALPTGVVVLDREGRAADCNPAAQRMLGLSREQVLGRVATDVQWRILNDDLSDCPPALYPGRPTLASGRAALGQSNAVRMPDGTLRWLLVNSEPVVEAGGAVAGAIVCMVDVTEQRAQQQLLRENARTDALTGLPNRSVVVERVEVALARWQRHGEHFAVLFMDFDRFKQVNDTLGHSAGDELLRQVARRLQAALRRNDAVARVAGSEAQLAARLGGDEFVIVLDHIRGSDDACSVARRLLDDLATPYEIDGHTVHSSASIGVVTAEHASPDAEDILRDADTAMYEAKRAGKGRFVLFDTAMHERISRHVQLEEDLREGLARDELYVVYQPVVDLGGGRIVGVEALARWQHPVRGAVSPAEFIPVAEDSGLIGAIGDLVLERACTQFMQWRAALGEQAPKQLAVNLSRAQLRLSGIVDTVHETLQRSGMPPACLQLELTESLAAQDEGVQRTLRELKALGVTVALDDFGTGYSSLACLHLLPVDTVKIDRSFVRHAEGSEYHRVLIEATIRVAQALGMTVVAEGIETPGQALLLHALRCDKGQGFLYGRPQAAADMHDRLLEEGAVAA